MNVLLGTDGSRYALAAARFLTDRLRERARVTLVTALPRSPLNPHRRYGKPKSVEARWTAAAGRWQDRTEKPLRSHGHEVERVVKTETAAEVLTEMAASGRFDLVAAGAKGRGRSPYFGVGSVAGALLEHAPIPVLLVREPDPRRGRQPPERMRVVLPTDGKAHSAQAARYFVSAFRQEEVELETVCVAEDVTPELQERLSQSERRRLRDESRHLAGAWLHLLEEELEPEVSPARSRVLEGRPADEVLEAARGWEADLVVMGSRGAADPRDRRTGSVALEIAQSAPCSVLVVRESAPSGEAP